MQRQYFYEIDSAGWLYHDGSRLTDVAFLNFFFKRVRARSGSGPLEYPYESPCGREMNYIRCSSTPFVFTALRDGQLFLNHSNLQLPLQPDQLELHTRNHCLYHPAMNALPGRLHTNLQLELAAAIQEKDGQYSIGLADGKYPIPVRDLGSL